jgi:hypothetical protein
VRPPQIHFDGNTGFVSHVEFERWCLCGYRETGFVNVDKDPVWTEIVDETSLTVEQEIKERARLASQWFMGGMSVTPFKVDPINWQQDGLDAIVVIDGVKVDTLLETYNHFRLDENFHQWLRQRLKEETHG